MSLKQIAYLKKHYAFNNNSSTYTIISLAIAKFYDGLDPKCSEYVSCREFLHQKFRTGHKNQFLIIRLIEGRKRKKSSINRIQLAVKKLERKLKLKERYCCVFHELHTNKLNSIYAIELKEFWSKDLFKFSFLTGLLKISFYHPFSETEKIVENGYDYYPQHEAGLFFEGIYRAN